jgi:nucleoside-diphosphate-sugar epimerase
MCRQTYCIDDFGVKILVTGASGFVGGSFVRRFSGRQDLEIFGVARRPLEIPNYFQRDLAEPLDLPLTPDVVIHAAARASPWGTRNEFERQNVLATKNVLNFCEQRGRPKLVYISSSSVFYRHESQLNLTESSPIGPAFINDYAATKYEGELLVNRYRGNSAIVRPRAVFGPGDTVLFPRILRAAREGKMPVFKQVGPPAQGDLIYIDTLCDYLLQASMREDVVGDFNLTNAQPVVIQELVVKVLSALGVAPPTRKVAVSTAMFAAFLTEGLYRVMRLTGEPPITRFGVSVFAHSKTFDVTKMLHVFGAPSVSLEEGTARFIEWQRAQP